MKNVAHSRQALPSSAFGVSLVGLLLDGLALAIALEAVDGAARCQRKEWKLLDVLAALCALQIEGSYIVHRS